MYILIQGEVDHFFNGGGEKVTTDRQFLNNSKADLHFSIINIFFLSFKPGDFFGVRSFFTDEIRESSAISKNISIVYEIKKKDFLSILKKSSLDYVNFLFL